MVIDAVQDIRTTKEWEIGHHYEQALSVALREHGWHLIDSYAFSGEEDQKAPRLQGLPDSYVLPDLDASQDGMRRWIEVKAKAKSILFRKTGTWIHGIDQHLFESYLAVQAITGAPVYLIVVELATKKVLAGRLDALRIDNRDTSAKVSKSGMVNFDRQSFSQVGIINHDSRLVVLKKPVDWEK